ncbi:MAG: ExbD/TolR family protein [Pirellulaceae bacterium]
MRRSSPYLQRQGDVSIQMTPLIDVVFLLMVFFVWTAGFQVAEYMLPSKLLASAGTGSTAADEPPPPEEDFEKVVVRVLWVTDQPAWKINDASVETLQEVRSRLEAIANIKRDAAVILHPDQEVPLGHVIDLYDIARRVGFAKIQFAASEKI